MPRKRKRNKGKSKDDARDTAEEDKGGKAKPVTKGGGAAPSRAQSKRERGDIPKPLAQPEAKNQRCTMIVSFRQMGRLAGEPCCPKIPVVDHNKETAMKGWFLEKRRIDTHEKQPNSANGRCINHT